MKISKTEFKSLLKEVLREYFLSSPPSLFKIAFATYLADGEQQVEDDRVLDSNIQGMEKAKQFLMREVKNGAYFLKRDYQDVKEPQVISDTEIRVYFTDDGDEYYRAFCIIPQKPKLSNEQYIIHFLDDQFPWKEHIKNVPGRWRHPLDPLYDAALQELGFLTDYDDQEGLIYVFEDIPDNADPCAEYPAEDEFDFMDKLTNEYLSEFTADGYVSNRTYIDKIKKFIQQKLEEEGY